MDARRTSINIRGQKFSILTDKSDEEMVKVEEYINDLFEDIKKSNPNIFGSDLPFIAALQLTENYLELKKFNEYLLGKIRDISVKIDSKKNIS